jgi:hypothetical protein
MKAQYCFSILVAVTFSLNTYSQQDSVKEEKVKFKLGVYYNSNLNYYGRTDSLGSSGFFPLGEIWFGKNFYINAAPVFVNNAIASFEYAGTIATAGYLFNSNQHFGAHIYLVKPIYRESSQLVQSALKAQLNASITWMNKILNLTAGADAKWSDRADFGAMASADHVFRFNAGSKLLFVVNPTVAINAGTQQFARTYYEKTGGFLIFPGIEQEVTTTGRAFNILSYELSAPLIMALGKMQWLLTPAYVIPQNLVTIDGRPELSETGKKMFYITAGMKFNF